MAIIAITELSDDEIGVNDKGQLEGRRSFLVKTDTPARPSIALDARYTDTGTGTTFAVPARLSPYDTAYPSCLLMNKVAKRHQGEDCHFVVECSYSQPEGTTTTPPEPGTNPLDEGPEFNYSANEASEAYMVDNRPEEFWVEIDGVNTDIGGGPQYITNSAGEPFEENLERDAAQDIITVTTNEQTHDPAAAKALRYTINDRPVTFDGKTYAPLTLLMRPIQAQTASAKIPLDPPDPENPDATQTVSYYRKTYVLWWKPEGWLDRELDIGMNELIPDPTSTPTQPKGPKLRPILDAAQCAVKKPVPLNGFGLKLAFPPGTEVPPAVLANPSLKYLWEPGVREFWPYKPADWSDLPFVE